MFAYNPFIDLTSMIPLSAMQVFVGLMILLVVGGTLYDVMHKRSAKYFFDNMKKSERGRTRRLSGSDKASLAAQTVMSEVLTSSEFCNPNRRLAHLLTMYGFIFYVGSTVALVFWYSTRGSATPAILPLLWHLGALMICIGGYWFWFFIRADVAAEGQSPFRVVRADLFVLSLLGSATMALVWSYLQWSGHPLANVALVLCLIATVVLFGSVPWSKFSHMFFKPAAAYQKRLIKADGSRENLPRTYDLSDPAVQRQFPDIPEYMGKNPPDMGLGIKREAPRHY